MLLLKDLHEMLHHALARATPRRASLLLLCGLDRPSPTWVSAGTKSTCWICWVISFHHMDHIPLRQQTLYAWRWVKTILNTHYLVATGKMNKTPQGSGKWKSCEKHEHMMNQKTYKKTRWSSLRNKNNYTFLGLVPFDSTQPSSWATLIEVLLRLVFLEAMVIDYERSCLNSKSLRELCVIAL